MKNKGISIPAVIFIIIILLALGGILYYIFTKNIKDDIPIISNQTDTTNTLLNTSVPLSSLYDKTGKEENKLHIGDYVDYQVIPNDVDSKTNKEYQYTSSKEKTGWNTNQTFTANSNIKWRVFGKENNNILLISDTAIPTDKSESFYLKGKEAYWNAPTELNKICAIYGKGINAKGARSINVEDINSITGYDKKTYTQYGEKNYTYSKGIFLNEDGTQTSLSSSKTVRPTSTYYTYKANAAPNTKDNHSIIYQMLFEKTDTQPYWLASRFVNPFYNQVVFGIGYVYDENIRPSEMFFLTNSSSEANYLIRPIVILEDNVKVESGEGTLNNPYTLEK